eukprot:2198608-Rhodomonas_salina.1
MLGARLPPGAIEFATDASLWGGCGTYEEERLVREWNATERKAHINILECLMVLHMCKAYGQQWKGLKGSWWLGGHVQHCPPDQTTVP